MPVSKVEKTPTFDQREGARHTDGRHEKRPDAQRPKGEPRLPARFHAFLSRRRETVPSPRHASRRALRDGHGNAGRITQTG
jgi:hypothetical protein